MTEIFFMDIGDRIYRGFAFLPAAHIKGGTIILDGVQHDSAIMISPFGIGLTMKGDPKYKDLKPEDSVEKILEDIITHELVHEFVEWNHENETFTV